MKKVTGIGGIFFKCKDAESVKSWYVEHLGFEASAHGVNFVSRNLDDPEIKETMVWSPFKETTKYFEPSTRDFMINYRVDDLAGLLEQLKAAGVTIVGEMQEYPPYGKFAHIMDPEGNKVELWQRGEDE